MSNFKFRGFIPAVTRYVKSKSPIEVIAEVFAFGVLLPLVISGLSAIIFHLIQNPSALDGAVFGIYG